MHFELIREWDEPVGEPYPGEEEIRQRLRVVAEEADTDGDGLIRCLTAQVSLQISHVHQNDAALLARAVWL